MDEDRNTGQGTHPMEYASEFDRMVAGELYDSGSEVFERVLACKRVLQRYNNLPVDEYGRRGEILDELLGSMGKRCVIVAPFHCDYGVNITLRDDVFINADCAFLDSAPIILGNHVLVGPQVGIYSPIHPFDAEVRATFHEMALPVTIGDDVWICGHATICPGVTIGDDVVIGAGAVVTKDVPSHVVAAGNPCRVIREITEEERETWRRRDAEYLSWRARADGRHPSDLPL